MPQFSQEIEQNTKYVITNDIDIAGTDRKQPVKKLLKSKIYEKKKVYELSTKTELSRPKRK